MTAPWTQDDFARMIGTLRQHYTVQEAAQQVGLTDAQFRNLARRFALAGLGKPSSYLLSRPRGPMTGAPIAGLDYDDDAQTIPQRDTDPCRMFVDREPEPEPMPYRSTALRRILFVPDTHRPYHCPHAWATMLAGARRFAPHVIVILGDFADFYAVSSHDKNPGRMASLADEVADVNVGLDELAALGAEEVYYVEGNHEWRLARYIAKNAAALHGLSGLTPRELFRIDERGFHWTDYMHSMKLGHITVTHDVGEAGIYAVKRARDAAEGNIVIGHIHSMGLHYSGTATGVVRVGAAFGWLGSAKAGDYIHAMKRARNWTHGFGIGFMEDDGTVHLQAVPIINGRCVVPTELEVVAA